MTNPLALFPLALASGGGRVGTIGAASGDDCETQQLVAAGVTLLQRSALLVRALRGKRSAILLPTSPAFITALAASDGRGAVLINPLAAAAEIAFQCADANVGAIFTTTAFASRLPDGMPLVFLDDAPRTTRVVSDGRTQDVDLGSHHGLSLEGERDVAGRDEEAVIVYTSAMRGTPLGAMLSHANLLANARSTVTALGNTADDHVLAALPFAHLFGLVVTAGGPLLAGGRVSTMERFNPAKAAELLADGITEFVGVPAIFHAVLSAISWREIDLRGSAVCLFNRVDRPNVRGTLGVHFPGVDVAILPPSDYSAGNPGLASPDVTPLEDGRDGEICVRGANVFSGYVGGAHGLPMRGDWLCTGDRGVRDANGSVRFLDLLKPMFTRNGFNIYPRELEEVIGAMPGVSRVYVSAIPDAAKENDIHVRIAGAVAEDDVKLWCASRLSAYKQPGAIEILAS
jgi:acyl-CoA synthetase (AMP-forming)/AMP-acid ligase II